jgi:gas vesicle protein
MKNGFFGFFSGLAAGFAAALLFTPLSGKDLRDWLFSGGKNEDEWQDKETYNIHELMSNGSTSLEELRSRIRGEERV